ncbi:HlyU family transcriptional regulator [Pelagibius sp. Alg239-R121]|uniref:HlyU family transcriptional regulator n=1 Tax=Pelagibius sp. Alg239-R121 TaxID=2993448 RepID=UPI0024A6A7B5|nr:HlyU family transcriptional regulator [Pelagibius sp. Alg239-R121]
MASFLSRILGGLTGKPPEDNTAPQRSEAVDYEGLKIRAAPEKADNQWRLAGVIIKPGDDGDLERVFIRADLFSSREEAETYSIRKGQQIIDEQGERLFADGAASGHT